LRFTKNSMLCICFEISLLVAWWFAVANRQL
jgi:hypothetical protein